MHFGGNGAQVSTGKKVLGFATRKQAQLNLGWNIDDQSNNFQRKHSRHKEITGKITTNRNQETVPYQRQPSEHQKPLGHRNAEYDPFPVSQKYSQKQNKNYQQPSNSPYDRNQPTRQYEQQYNYQPSSENYNGQEGYDYSLPQQQQQYQNQPIRQPAENYERPIVDPYERYGVESRERQPMDQLERQAIEQYERELYNKEQYERDSRKEQLEREMANFEQKRQNQTPSQPESHRSSTLSVERRAPIKPKQSMRDIIYNGVGVNQPISLQRRGSRKINSQNILGGDNYAYMNSRN